jgi:hypothetical protein
MVCRKTGDGIGMLRQEILDVYDIRGMVLLIFDVVCFFDVELVNPR